VTRARAARRAASRKRTRDAQSITRRTAPAAAAMPMLRQPHDRHRDLRARLRTEAPAFAGARDNQDRHLMIPPPVIRRHHCSNARHSCWFSAGHAQAHIGMPDSPAVARSIRSPHAQIARSHRRMRPSFAASRSRQPFQSSLSKPKPVAKSP
jgi:hypothetical protein